MPFFKRKANPPLDGTQEPIPMPAVEPVISNGNENQMQLARTRTEDIVYPHGFRLALIIISTFMTMFLVALVCALLFYELFFLGTSYNISKSNIY